MEGVAIDGVMYSTGKLDAFKQAHLARRLIPVLPGLLASVMKVDIKKLDGGQVLLMAAGPVGQAFAFMPQDDADYVMRTCLAVCQRQDGGVWAPLMTPGGELMYKDLKLKELVQLCVVVIKENLGNFLPVQGTKA